VATIYTHRLTSLAAVVSRVRRVFDLDADIAAIDTHLSRDPVFAARVRARPGIRVPGAWDGFELAVRGVLGQQITVRAATTFAGRLAATFGESLDEESPGSASELRRACRGAVVDASDPHLIFPTPAALAEADISRIALTRARAAALRSLGAAMTRDPRLLQGDETLDETIRRLCTLPGIGPWTAQYIAMRALREPDAFPATDLGLLRAMQSAQGRPSPAALTQAAEAWRPWRAYAAVRLWIQASGN
jgi:AraC family transcriptional regulator of adaptative response / DNA-3-methyladenine glycosylase II